MNTYITKKEDVKSRKWHIVDAKGKVLGRVALKVAIVLMGKNKPTYTPFVDSGEGVVVINAKDITVTGNKGTAKTYSYFSGYPSGLKTKTLDKLMSEKPQEVIRAAVKGMLPKNKLGRDMFSRLKVYAGAEHPHKAQEPQELVI